MADEDPKDIDPNVDPEKDTDPDPEKDTDPDPEKDQDPKDKPKLDPDHQRAIARRDRALRERDAAREEARKLKEKYEPQKADPVQVANRRLVTAETRTVLTARGITDPDEQKTVASFLGLDTVSVTDDGDVDTAEIEDRVEKLAKVFAGLNGGKAKVPRLDPRDRGGEKPVPKDAARARREQMLRGR